jgi:Helix-turn-helix domain
MSTQPQKQPLVVRWRLALRADQLSRSAKLLGYTIATYADNRTGSTFVGLPLLASDCGFSVDTASRARAELHRRQYLNVAHRAGLTSVVTLRLPTARVRGVPTARSPKTHRTGAGVTLNNSDRRGVVDDSARLSFEKASRWVANVGRLMPADEAAAELREHYGLSDDEIAGLLQTDALKEATA